MSDVAVLRELAALQRRMDELETREAPVTGKLLGTWQGSKNIGDNVATAVATITIPAVTDWSGALLLTLNNRSSVEQGYASVSEVWLVGLRCQYNEGTGTYNLGAGTPANLGRSDAGSSSASFADVGNATVTVATDTTNHVFTISVQADHSGTSGGIVVCNWQAQLFCTGLVGLSVAGA